MGRAIALLFFNPPFRILIFNKSQEHAPWQNLYAFLHKKLTSLLTRESHPYILIRNHEQVKTGGAFAPPFRRVSQG